MKKNRKYWDFSKKSCISAVDYRIRYKRRDGRAVEYSSLENCCAVTGTGGSNPSLSALFHVIVNQNPLIAPTGSFGFGPWLCIVETETYG